MGVLTTPQEAKQFVDATKIDVLAPAVGNMHGLLQSMVYGETQKRLDIQRIAEIKAAAGIFMTLHGGSGTYEEDFEQAIKAGMTIVHVNTELRLDGAAASRTRWKRISTRSRPIKSCRRWSGQ